MQTTQKWCQTCGGELFQDSENIILAMDKKLYKEINEKLSKSLSAYRLRKAAYENVMNSE